jgi:hypothetical protein
MIRQRMESIVRQWTESFEQGDRGRMAALLREYMQLRAWLKAMLAVLLLCSTASAAPYRVLGVTTVNGQRIVVVEKVSTRRAPVVYRDPLQELWRTSTPQRRPPRPAIPGPSWWSAP